MTTLLLLAGLALMQERPIPAALPQESNLYSEGGKIWIQDSKRRVGLSQLIDRIEALESAKSELSLHHARIERLQKRIVALEEWVAAVAKAIADGAFMPRKP